VLGRKGSSVHVRSPATALHSTGHSVVVAAPVLNKSPWEQPAQTPFRVLHIPVSTDCQAAASGLRAFTELLGVETTAAGAIQRILYDKHVLGELRSHFRNNLPDFIYERASVYSTAGVRLAAELGVPLLLELNAPLALEQEVYRRDGMHDLARHCERWTLERADAVLAVSTTLRHYATSLVGDASRVHVVPNGVDTDLFAPRPRDPALRKRFQLDDRPTLGFVGGLRPWHGTDLLPLLLERLLQKHCNLQLVIVGNGPMEAIVEQDFAKRGLQEHVIFTGSIAHDLVSRLAAEFDIGLVPYAQPSHDFYFSPLKLFESMACGVPVVATAIGQIQEVVCDGETGLLCPPGDLESMTAACDRLLTDSGLRRRLGLAAAQHIRAHYTWSRNANRVIEVAQQMVQARKACL
jgi:glycosyltransferase involved in cell wall biosynthesis